MKTKVIAFRVTEQEYQLLTELTDDLGNITFSKLFAPCVAEHLVAAEKVAKRREAQLKRAAKKAEANVLD